jgi:glycosyltransferase involved in cell wall biosynthesis
MRLSMVLWDGNVGGAEKLTAELAGGLRSIGVDARIVFVRDPGALAADLDRIGVPYESFGARRVEEVLVRPRRFARLVSASGPDGALLPAIGHLAPALRIGGFRAPLVAMEHGILLLLPRMPLTWRVSRRIERRFSAPFVDAQVAVSSFMRDRLLHAPHARRVEVIENGIDLARYTAPEPPERESCVFAFASRFVPGKGVPELIAAFAQVARDHPEARLRIAGDGPERGSIEEQIARLPVADRVELPGVVDDMPSYWREADVAVMPSTAPESFGMVALEAMAAARPVVATRNGGADDVVHDGVTGRLVGCGQVDELAAAMLEYAGNRDVRQAHGAAGRARCEERFTIDRCAARYAGLVGELARGTINGDQPAGGERVRARPPSLEKVSGHVE